MTLTTSPASGSVYSVKQSLDNEKYLIGGALAFAWRIYVREKYNLSKVPPAGLGR